MDKTYHISVEFDLTMPAEDLDEFVFEMGNVLGPSAVITTAIKPKEDQEIEDA